MSSSTEIQRMSGQVSDKLARTPRVGSSVALNDSLLFVTWL